MLKGQYTTINPVKELQQRMRYTNYAYDENTANKYANAGQLYNYLYMIDKVGKTKEAFDNFKSQYKDYDFLDDDYKDFVLVNETQMKPGTYTDEEFEKLSDEEKKIQNQLNKKTLRTWKDENGQEVSEEMTDYDWNKKLIDWKTDELEEERKVELFNKLQESKNFWQKAGEGIATRFEAFGRNIITGAVDAVGDLYNIFQGVYYFADNLINARNFVGGGADSTLEMFGPLGEMIDNAFVKANKENELAFIGENMEKMSYDWERDWGLRDYYGNYSHFDSLLTGIGQSFGRMLPTMLLSFAGGKVIQSIGKANAANVAKDVALMEGATYLTYDTSAALNSLANTSQLLFYAGMAQGDITEMLNDPETAGLSSFAIFTNAYAKAGMELAVEKGLDKLLGTTTIDSMAYGFKSRTGKTLIGKLATDALHEGLEEVLQDYSHIWVDRFFTAFNYALGNEEYAEIFTKTSEFTFQTAMDAFISGALMSLMGASFRILTTKRVNIGVTKYDKEGNPIVDKKALKKFTKTGELDAIYKTEKLSKGKSYMFNETMRDVQDSINTLMKDQSLTVEEKSDVMSGLKSSLDTMTAIFNGFGQERFNKAMSLLNTMDTVYQQHKAASELQRELSDYFKDFAIAKSDENLKRITDRQLKNPKYTVTRNTDFDTELEGLKAEKDTIQQILNDCKDVEKVTVTESGVGPTITEDGKTIIVPENQIKNLSAEALLKDITEQIIVSKITKTPQLKLVTKRIYDIFKKLPINQGKTNLTQDMAISYLLLNDDFARICLYTNESTMVDFISKLDIVVKSIDVKDVFTVQRRDMLKRSIEALSNLYMQYCIDMQYASPNVTLLTDEQRANIENKRWNKNLTNKIQEGKPLSKNDLTNLDNRINSLTVDDVTKNNLKAGLRSESDIIRIQAYDSFTKLLNEKEYAEFYSLFDNKTYPKQRTMTNMLLYNFLRSNGITLKNLVNKPEYKQLFEEYTDGNYTYERENGIYIVKELTKLGYGKRITPSQEKKMIVRDYATVDVRSKNSDFDRSILKSDINSAYRDMIDINDVITMPSVLTNETRTSIKDKYGALTPYNTFKYLNTKFLQDSNGIRGINIDQNGNFYMVDVSDVQTMKTDTFDKNVAKIQNDYKLAKEGDTKAQERLDRGYKIKSFIQNEFVIRPEDASVRIIVDDDVSGASYDELTNTISLGIDDIEHAGTYILHEYKHAIQSHNGLNKGFDVEFINADTNASDKAAIIKDMKAHMSLGKGDIVKAINNAIYHGTGEASAYGYAFDPDIDYTVFIRKDLPDGTITITTPWGAVYSMKGNRITIKQQAKLVPNVGNTLISTEYYKSQDKLLSDEFGVINLYNLKHFELEDAETIVKDLKLTITAKELLQYRDNYEELCNSNIITDWTHYANFGTSSAKNDVDDDFDIDFDEDVDVNINYGEDARIQLYNRITPELKNKMLQAMYYETKMFAVCTYEEFLNMDIPYFRYQTGDKLYDSNTFLSCSVGLDGLNLLEDSIGDRERSGYLIVGTIKPKDVVGYVPGDLYEVLISEKNIANSQSVFAIDITDGKFNFKVNNILINNKTEKLKTIINDNYKKQILDAKSLTWDNINNKIKSKLKESERYRHRYFSEYLYCYSKITSNIQTNIFVKSDNYDVYAGNYDYANFCKSTGAVEIQIDNYSNKDEVNLHIYSTSQRTLANLETVLSKIEPDISVNIVSHSGEFQDIKTVKLDNNTNIIKVLDNVKKKFVELSNYEERQEILYLKLSSQMQTDYKEAHPDAEELDITKLRQRAKTIKDFEPDTKVETEKSQDDIYVSEQEYAELQKNKAKLAKTRKQKYNKRTYVSKEREAHTNLKYYGGKQMDTKIQDVIRFTTGSERNYDPKLIEIIKNGEFVTKSDVYDYVRANDMDDNTFNLLNKNYFKNVNISSLSQLNTLVKSSANYYAIRAALRAYAKVLDVDVSNYLYGALNTNQIKKLLLELKEKAPNAYKIYQDVKSRFDTNKAPVDFESLKIAYLTGYDGTLDSAARIASWAKQLAMNKSLKRAGSKVDISTEQSIKDTKGENLTIGEQLAEQYSFEMDFEDFPFGNDDIKQMATELVEDRIAAYYNKLVGVKNRNASSKELEKIIKQKGLDITTIKNEVEKIKNDIMDMSDEDVIEAYRSTELSEMFSQDVKYRVDLQRNLQQKADRVKEALAGKKKAYEKLVELYPDLGFTADKEWHIPTKENRVLNKEEILNLSERMSQILKYARAGAFDPLVNKMQTQIGKQQDLIAELQLKQKKLQDKLKQTKSDIKTDYTKRHDDIHLSNTELTIESTRRMPEKFKEVLDTVFSKLSNTKGKFANVNEMHTVKSYSEWIDANYDVLSSIDEIDAVEILDYIMNSSVMYAKFGSDDFVRFNAVSLFMLSYLYENADLYHIDNALLVQAERVFDTIKSNAGTTLAISRALMEKANPTERIFKQLSKSANFGIKQSEIDELTKAVKKYQDVSKDNSKAEIALGEVEAIYQKIFVRALNDYKGDKRQFLRKAFAFQKMAMLSSPGTWIRNAVSNIIIEKTDTLFAKVGTFVFTKTAKAGAKLAEKRSTKILKPQFDIKYNTGLEYAQDNYGYDVTEFDTKTTRQTIDKMLKEKALAEKLQSEDAETKKERRIKIQSLEERLDNLHQKRSLVSDLTNRIKLDAEIVKVNNEIDMYVNPAKYATNIANSIDSLEAWIKYNKNLDMYNKKISGTDFERTMKGQYKLAGTVIDAKTKDWVQTMVIESGFFDMIKDGLNKYNVSSTGSDIESKITKLIVESIQNKIFMTNQFDTKALNKTSELLYKMLSDDRWINRTFASYLGKMLVEDKIDLTQGYTDEVLNHIADAYTMAAWTYMHKKNFLNDLDNIIRTRFGEKAYFVYKQFFPFATTAYNWFVEGLNFTPVGLVTNIKNAMNLEAYINKLDVNYAKGIGPNSRFASYILRRNIGKGLIGSAFWLVAALLGVFGVIKVRDDEYGNAKIQCGNVQIDFTDLYGTTGFGMGLVMGSAIYDKKKDVYDVLGDTLNTMFDDSIFSDVADLFKYNGDVGNILLSKPESVIKSFIPNILATFSSMLYNNEVQYSTGFKGRLEKIIARMIPGYAYALPTKYDIYTGEKQYKYYPSFAGFISAAVSKFTSVKINTPKVSNLENIAMKYGVMKGNLTGSYKDVGQFSSKQVSELNKKYGELNNAVLTDFFNNKIKYKVQDKKTGKYSELYYKQMTDEQKKTVITRIMSNNSKFAKIYVWTSEGHKYYCTKSEYYELMRLGITKNIRVGSSDKLVDPFKV